MLKSTNFDLMISIPTESIELNFADRFNINTITPLSGGDINAVFEIRTSDKKFCIKLNSTQAYPDMFLFEQKGLDLLRSSKFDAPQVIETGELDGYSYLLMSFIESGKEQNNFWQSFGVQLAEMHQISNKQFGLDHNNYIGSLKQLNNQHTDWSEFFALERLLAQTKLAFDNGHLNRSFLRKIEFICSELNNLIPKEQPALLHGDLWSGNFMVNSMGSPVLIDPAVYYGHREMDIAMTKLFGGFDEEMYRAYNSCYPLESGWHERINLCNLYPLLVHVNLFGASYIPQVESIVQQYQ